MYMIASKMQANDSYNVLCKYSEMWTVFLNNYVTILGGSYLVLMFIDIFLIYYEY